MEKLEPSRRKVRWPRHRAMDSVASNIPSVIVRSRCWNMVSGRRRRAWQYAEAVKRSGERWRPGAPGFARGIAVKGLNQKQRDGGQRVEHAVAPYMTAGVAGVKDVLVLNELWQGLDTA